MRSRLLPRYRRFAKTSRLSLTSKTCCCVRGWSASLKSLVSEIIGEALSQLSKLDAALVARIPDAPQIISFRNQLIHGYATISNKLVWSVVLDDLPGFVAVINGLLAEAGSS